MDIHKNYDLKSVNLIVNNGTRIEKCVHGINVAGESFSPLSEYLYLLGHYEAIDDIMIEIDAALVGQLFNDGIEVGTETITLTQTMTTIVNSDGRTQTIPTADLKAIILEYKTFLNTPPLDGSYISN